MSEHVQRAEPNRINLFIIVIGLFCGFVVFLYEAYKTPRLLRVEAAPNSAKLYIGNNLECANLPCQITQIGTPKPVWVRANGYYAQRLKTPLLAHYTSDFRSVKVVLSPFTKRDVKSAPRSQPDSPAERPKGEASPRKPVVALPHKPKSRQSIPLPLECQETSQERQNIQNRQAVLCSYEEESIVNFSSTGECYASYRVTTEGRVTNIQGLGCMHDVLLMPAMKAFERRIYLPALKNGIPVEMRMEADIQYGPQVTYSHNPAITVENTTVNGDARVLSCPPLVVPKAITRSGHCIFEFDLSSVGRLTQIRQIKCTDAALKGASLTSLEKCTFKPAMTDGTAIDRPYMTHQFNVEIFDKEGNKIPLHASFGEKSVNKPYIYFE